MWFVTKRRTIYFLLLILGAAGFGFRRQDAPKPNPALDAALIDAIEKQSKPASDAQGVPVETPEEIAAVKQLLEAGASPDAQVGPADTRFYSPKAKVQTCALLLATGWNQLNVVRLLVEHGANVNVREEWGATPLLLCSDDKQVLMARYLIEHGADVNAQQNDGISPLYWAAGSRNLDYLRFLLEHGANPNVQEKRGGSTPLMSSAGYGQVEAIKLLLAHGADASFVTNSGATAMTVAKVRGNDEVLKLLLASRPKMSLREAARVGDAGTVRALLDAGEKVNTPDKRGNAPIVGAVAMDSLDTVRLLLERGADVNARLMLNRGGSSDGQKQTLQPGPTLLMTAAGRDYPDMAALLLSRGANINAAYQLPRGWQTALTNAVQAGNLAVVKMLLRRKPDLKAHQQGGRALALSLEFGSIPRDMRLKRGKHYAKGHDSRPEDEAARNAILDLMLALPLNYKKDGGFALCAAAGLEANAEAFVKILLEKGANVNFIAEDGRTPLICAIQAEQTGAVSLLLAHGASLHAATKEGTTPLEFAIAGENKKIIALLKRADAKK